MHDINFAPIISPETLRPTATLEEDSDYDRNHVYRVLRCSKCGTRVYSEEWYGKGSVPLYIHYRYTMRCTSSYSTGVEDKIKNFLSRSDRDIEILNITQYSIEYGIYTTIWFVYKD